MDRNNLKGQTKRLPEQIVPRVVALVKEFKCPQCKAYTLFVKNDEVRCRKCGYSSPLYAFAVSVMSYAVADGRAFVKIPDLFGGEPKVVDLGVV